MKSGWSSTFLAVPSLIIREEQESADRLADTMFRVWAIQDADNRGKDFIFMVDTGTGNSELIPAEGSCVEVVRLPWDGYSRLCFKAERFQYHLPDMRPGTFTLKATVGLGKTREDDAPVFEESKFYDITVDGRNTQAESLPKFLSQDGYSFRAQIQLTTSFGPHSFMASANEALCNPSVGLSTSRPSPESVDRFRYILGFEDGNMDMTTLASRYPHLRWPLDEANHDKVDPKLLDIFKALSPDKKAVYEAFIGSLPSGIQFVNGVAGCGKTHLLSFIVMMAIHGVKGKIHKVRVLFISAQNLTANGFATKLDKFFRARKSLADSCRLFPYDDEVDILTDKIGGTNKVTGKRMGRKDAGDYPALWKRALEYYHGYAKNGGVQKITGLLQKKGQNRDDRIWYELRSEVDKFMGRTLGRMGGVITATPYSSSYTDFRTRFQPDIVLVDEASRLSEGEFGSVLYNSRNPTAIMVTGDTRQLPVFVSDKLSKQNPFAMQMQKSTLHRAVECGVNGTDLVLNHRARNDLHKFVSQVFYKRTMELGPDIPPHTANNDAWRDFLHASLDCRVLPEFPSVWIGIPRAKAEKVGGESSQNEVHGQVCLDLAFSAIRDKKLGCHTVLIVTAYRSQVAYILGELRKRRSTLEERKKIIIRTIDGSQGEEAQFVIADFVQTRHAGHTTDENRLTVAMSRAREAQVVLFNMDSVEEYRDHCYGKTARDMAILRAYWFHTSRQQDVLLDCCPGCRTVFYPLGSGAKKKDHECRVSSGGIHR